MELSKEAQRQEENDKLRKEFAKHANAFHQLLTDTRWVFLYFSCILLFTLTWKDLLAIEYEPQKPLWGIYFAGVSIV